MIRIKRQDAVRTLIENKGAFFGAIYKRTNPKCNDCGKSNKKWIGEIKCPKCDGKLSYIRSTAGLLGVKNPGGGITAPGEGKEPAFGDFLERLEKGYVTYYDPNADGDRNDGKTGGYRMFKIENLITLKLKNAEFEIVD